MNYLWEILLQAKAQGIREEDIRFLRAKQYSPYMELSEKVLNATRLEEPCRVEVNPYYRFDGIFGGLFHPEVKECPALREGLFALMMHLLAENDVRMGMTRDEYHKKLLEESILLQTYGEEVAEAFRLFDNDEKEILLEGMLLLYRSGESLALLKYVASALIPGCIVYESNDNPDEILIYTSSKKTERLQRRTGLVLGLFLGIRYRAEVYYEYHFGIIGIPETMMVDEIAVC